MLTTHTQHLIFAMQLQLLVVESHRSKTTISHSTTWYLLLYHNAHQHTLYYMVSTALSQCSPTHTLLHGIYCSITMLTNTHSTTWYLLLYHNAHQHTLYCMVSTALSQCSPTHTLLHGIYCSITMLTNTHSTTWYLLLYHNAHQHTLLLSCEFVSYALQYTIFSVAGS